MQNSPRVSREFCQVNQRLESIARRPGRRVWSSRERATSWGGLVIIITEQERLKGKQRAKNENQEKARS
jgi:RNA polymerase subunit RPABC4/transcription elongation factor Spt4